MNSWFLESLKVLPSTSAKSLKGSIFNIKPCPPIKVFTLTSECHKKKGVDLIIGMFKTIDGKSYLPEVAKLSESTLKNIDHSKLSARGHEGFLKLVTKLILGEDLDETSTHVSIVQSLGGTGSLRIAGEYIKMGGIKDVLIMNPTWGNHNSIFESIGHRIISYNYLDSKNSFDVLSMINKMKSLPLKSVIILHTCAHNPTGVDPDSKQWKLIINTIKEYNHIPIFDSAYLGFASGDVKKDLFPIQECIKEKIPIFVSFSASKNMGMYGERIGALLVITPNRAPGIQSRLEQIVTNIVGYCPRRGAEIANGILSNFKENWFNEVRDFFHKTLINKRDLLYNELLKLNIDWKFIIKQKGMFIYTPFTPNEVLILKNQYNVFLLPNGRISVSGITPINVSTIANSIKEVYFNSLSK